MENNNTQFEVIECICSWYDLLGFGQPLMDSSWNLTDERCRNQLRRITDLDLSHSNVFSSAKGTTTFSLNDGIIVNFDIDSTKPKSFERVVAVIDDLVLEYEMLNVRDVSAGFPGMRGIITFGQRYNYTQAESTISVLNDETISYHPRAFQMNTAFSKAYIIESSGSKAGIAGNNLFIDIYLLSFIECLIQKENNNDNHFRIESELHEDSGTKYFSIFRGEDMLLKLNFDNDSVDYNNKGITTKLFKFKTRESRQDQLANESAFKEGQRYLQMEKDGFEAEQ